MVFERFSREQLNELGLKYVYSAFHRYPLNNITEENFKLLEDEYFLTINNLGKAKIAEMIWFRDYLNGKVIGKYEKEERVKNSIELIYEEKIKKHIEKERKLIEKINFLKEENKELKSELNELKKKEKKYEELREFFLFSE